MRYEPLHIGDLVCIRGHTRKLGVVTGLFTRKNVYYVWWFDTYCGTVAPLAILKKIGTDTFCP